MCSGDSALHAAAITGDALTMKALIKAGADVEQRNGYDD
jgi:ankyrin repeat protein